MNDRQKKKKAQKDIKKTSINHLTNLVTDENQNHNSKKEALGPNTKR